MNPRTYLLIIAASLIAFQTSGRAADLDVPVLAVQTLPDGKLEGALHTCTVSITNRKVDKPLTVSITEDSPSAIGAQMRAAVWLAATTVALERGDPLTGYRIDISFDGSIDGPSAGGVIALAILSALDNRKLPQDFAFTGTILPNGGVGQVGGVLQKIQAAAKAGKKRVLVPNFYRVDTDPVTGKTVDFKDLCESLGVEFVPVSNLRDAYRSVYKLDNVPEPQSALKLSPALEKILKDEYAKEIEIGDTIFGALPDAEKEALKQDPMGKEWIKARSAAEDTLRQGNFSLAYEKAVLWGLFLSARQRNEEFYRSIISSANVIDCLSQEVSKGTNELSDNLSSYARSKSWTNKANASELDELCREMPPLIGIVNMYSLQIQSAIEERKKIAATKSSFLDSFKSGPSQQEQLNTIDHQISNAMLYQLLIINVCRECFPADQMLMEKYEKLYKDCSPTPQAFHRNCENLVYNASSSADESFTADNIQELAKQAGIDVDEAKAKCAMNSSHYLSLICRRNICAKTHQHLNDTHDFYEIALATQDHGFALAAATRLSLEVQCGESENEDGKTTYSNTGLVRSLLDSSRNEAVTAIAKCEAVGIPCWNPTMLVLSADGEREDTSEDRMDILERYLQAGVQAKILNLLFSTPPPESKITGLL